MSLSNQAVKQTYSADGSTTTFAIPFAFIPGTANQVVKVYTYDPTDPQTGDPTLIDPSDYTLDPVGDTPTNVVFDVAPEDGLRVLIIRDLDYKQVISYINTGPFLAQTHEKSVDLLCMMIQQLGEIADRAVKAAAGYTTSFDFTLPFDLTPGASLVVNADGDGFAMGASAEDIDAAVQAAQDAAAAAASDASDALAAAASAEMDSDNAQAAQIAAEAAQLAAEAAQAAAEAAAAGVTGKEVVGSRASPVNVTDVGGIAAPLTTGDHLCFVQGSSGAVDISANPQIGAGTRVGQVMNIRGRNAINTILLEHGNGLVLNGACLLALDTNLEVEWDGTNWVEISRNEL